MKRVLLIENSSLDFYSARIPLANFLMEKGWDVYALVPNDEHVKKIQDLGIQVIVKDLNRKNKGISQLYRLIKTYQRIIKKYKIDIVHSFRFQPNLVNVLANFFNRRKVIIHITGLGIAFSNTSPKYLILKLISHLIFQVKLFSANRIIVQNSSDAKDMWFYRFWKKKIHIIPGSGINISLFDKKLYDKEKLREYFKINPNEIVFICITRLIWEKGINEMIGAFEAIGKSNSRIKLKIVGWTDEDNPRHVAKNFIEKFANHSTISFLGKRNDVKRLLAVADVFIYPSYYREGIPRGILEALSMSLPIITTNTPGCNLTVKPEINGYLIPARSIESIIDAVEKITSADNLIEMGVNSRLLAQKEFADQIIFNNIEELYNQ